MEDMASLWSYQESIDELKQKLLYTSLELESVKVEASEDMRKNKEYAKQLLQLVKIACQERDEARDQLQKLLNKVMLSTTPTEFFNNLPQLKPENPLGKPTKANSSLTESNSLSETYNYQSQKLLNKVMHSTTPTEFFNNLPQLKPETPLVKPTKANSSLTESNSLSETYNYQSHSSSPVDSIFDAVSSPELSNINIGDSANIAFVNQPFVQDYNGTVSTGLVSSGVPKIDQGSLVIDNLVKGKPLPQKGKLLQSVLEAGPLLQTLLVAGPLPRWRNPPPLQAFHIPPVSIKGCEAEIVTQKPAANSGHVPRSMYSQSYVEMSCASSQMLSTSMLNFANGPSGSCMGSGRLISAGANTNNYVPMGKRQRFQ